MNRFLGKTLLTAFVMVAGVLMGGPVWACYLGAIIFAELTLPSHD
jgi:hypothetical protein